MNAETSPWWRQLFEFHLPELPKGIPSGLYHYRRESGGNVTRFHLRVEKDGSGLLLANSAVAARLSPAGVLIGKSLLEGRTPDQVRSDVRKRFRRVPAASLDSDLQKVGEFIETLANPEDNYPVFNLEDPAVAGHGSLMAPFHAQLPVAPPEQINPLLQKLWNCGVAQVTFHVVRGSVPDDAVLNIERAEDLGMISGLSAIASWMLAPSLFKRVARAGVDSVTVPVLFPEEARQDFLLGPGDFSAALQVFTECKRLEVCPVAEIPLFKDNVPELASILNLLHERRVRNVLYYAIAADRQPSGLDRNEIIAAAVKVEELAQKADVRYVWLPAVSRGGNLGDLLEEGPRSAGDVSIRVEADGSVFPSRGPKITAGNLLSDAWDRIWNHQVFLKYRERVESPTRCAVCPGLAICAADCPGEPSGFASEDNA